MKFIYFLIFFIIGIFAIHIIFYFTKKYLINDISNEIENMVNIPKINTKNVKWIMDNSCKYSMNKELKRILDKNDIEKSNNKEWNLHIPCTYNNISNQVSKLNVTDNKQRVYLIPNADQVVSKSQIWKHIVNKFGRSNAQKFMPLTYILRGKEKDNDIKLLKKEFDSKKIYIMKKDVQRQEGLKITNNLGEILDSNNNKDKTKYVIAQELLQDPYVLNGRKINMRFYLLIVCIDGKMGGYIHRNGFMYYTKDKFKKGSLEFGPNITTGYIDRKVYVENPLTLEDFMVYLDSMSRVRSEYEKELMNKNISISKLVFKRIYNLMKNILSCTEHVLCPDKKGIYFQLFGVDIALSNKLHPQLMEMNKGPDLSVKDERDGQVKRQVQEDILKTLKLVKNQLNNDFIEIY